MNTNTAERPKSAVSAIGADGALGPWVLVPHPPPWPHASIAFAASDNTIGFVYATGGFPAFADVNSARISADGSMAPFSPVGAPMPFDRYSHASTIANGHLYVVGGMSSKSKHFANLTDSVLVAPIDSSSGTLISCGTDCSPWTAATSLPTPRHSLALVESSGHLYAIGGVGDSGPVSELSVATLQPDGTLGPWRPATAQLPLALRAPAAMIANGRLYVIGGLTLTGPPLSTRVLVGHLAPDGDVLSWEDLETDRIIGGRLAHAVASWNGTFVYVSGGAGVEESPLSDVEFARIDPSTGHLLP